MLFSEGRCPLFFVAMVTIQTTYITTQRRFEVREKSGVDGDKNGPLSLWREGEERVREGEERGRGERREKERREEIGGAP